jgi:hypothetical protein
MKISGLEPRYEAARTWALHPVGRPPSGWSQLVRSGMATWVHQTHPPIASPSSAQAFAHPSGSPLLTVVAAMIAEVCP